MMPAHESDTLGFQAGYWSQGITIPPGPQDATSPPQGKDAFMLRFGSISLFGLIAITFAILNANPPNDVDARFNKALSVQAAMARARILLSEKNAQIAVDVLEEQLPKVNGNTEYLVLLRDAYRAYIRDLRIAGKADSAKRYLDRLCILDPSAANDPALKQAGEKAPYAFEQETKPAKTLQFPNFKMPQLPNPFAKKEEPKVATNQAAVIRALPQDSISEDPFDAKNQRSPSFDTKSNANARDLLTRGAAEFKAERYGEARKYFEQAYQAESTSLDVCREQWAYCIIKDVSDRMEQPGVLPGKLPDLRKQVDGAIQMAPTKMMAVGQQLLQQLDERSKKPQVFTSLASVRHYPTQNKEGWLVSETANFVIFHKQKNDYAERVAQVAEDTRAKMYRKWFGNDGVEWRPTCELILYPNAAAYTEATRVPANSPGHARIECDPSGRVVSRRLDMRMDANGMIEAVLPHETTHVVLAGMFGAAHVPRWCDEGIAVLAEPEEKIDLHRRKLLQHHKDGLLFGLKELMELKDYPHPRRIGAFYAQSVVLTEFLAQQKNPRVLTDFVKDGVRQGYEAALQKHFDMTFTQLEQLWQEQVLNNTTRFAQK